MVLCKVTFRCCCRFSHHSYIKTTIDFSNWPVWHGLAKPTHTVNYDLCNILTLYPMPAALALFSRANVLFVFQCKQGRVNMQKNIVKQSWVESLCLCYINVPADQGQMSQCVWTDRPITVTGTKLWLLCPASSICHPLSVLQSWTVELGK